MIDSTDSVNNSSGKTNTSITNSLPKQENHHDYLNGLEDDSLNTNLNSGNTNQNRGIIIGNEENCLMISLLNNSIKTRETIENENDGDDEDRNSLAESIELDSNDENQLIYESNNLLHKG